MPDSERSPLLQAPAKSSTSSPDGSRESTPLLASVGPQPQYDAVGGAAPSSPSLSAAPSSDSRKSRRWPSIIAIGTLGILAIAIIFGAYFVPAAVEKYAKEAVVIEPTNLSLESITTDGVRARIQANFRLDGSRVKDDQVRRVGRLATSIVRQLGTEETVVTVHLPDYDSVLLGTATVPPLVFDLVDGHSTAVDFVADLVPGDAEGIRTITNEWLRGKLDTVRLRGTANIHLKTGLLSLGTHTVSETLVFEANNVPQVPQYNITKLNFQDVVLPDRGTRALGADVAIVAFNNFPIQLDVPGLGFDVLVPGCGPNDPFISVAHAKTMPIAVRPRSDVIVNGRGVVEDLPESFTKACPSSQSSPLDLLLRQFLDGDAPAVFVRGSQTAMPNTPGWLVEILASILVPVPVPGSGSYDNLIREFSVTDVHFSLPDPYAEPDDPSSNPMVSGTILVSAAVPSEMNFSVNVTAIRADADVFYKKKKLGVLSLDKWQPANSTRTSATKDREARLNIQSRITDAPLNVTDGDVLTEVIEHLILRGQEVALDISAAVDVQAHTVLGDLVLNDIPAKGKIPVKLLSNGTPDNLDYQLGHIKITDTAYSYVSLEALVNVTNPTPYTASIPWVNVHVLCNGTVVGHATASNLQMSTGENHNLRVGAMWNPTMSGDRGEQVGRDLISQYLSGFNTSITLRAHAGSIPSLPLLGEALSRIDINVLAPRLKFPGKDDDEAKRFIRDATFHVFSSTATFTLLSPLEENVLYIEHVNATAFYNHTEPVGTILYEMPFAATPGASQTPRLPVEWSLGSDGFQKLKNALGGSLKLDARAVVGVRLGNWRETVWYIGRGIGASIRV